MSRHFEHSIDHLRLYGYEGAEIDDVVDALKSLKREAKKKNLTSIRAVIGPRDNLACIDRSKKVDPSLRLFVIAEGR